MTHKLYDIKELTLGRKKPYFNFITFPIAVDARWDVVGKALKTMEDEFKTKIPQFPLGFFKNDTNKSCDCSIEELMRNGCTNKQHF